jgi:hypothetical protein
MAAAGGQAGYADGTSGTPLKRYLDAAVLTADRIDYWIRRRVIACPLGSAGDVPRPARANRGAASGAPTRSDAAAHSPFAR